MDVTLEQLMKFLRMAEATQAVISSMVAAWRARNNVGPEVSDEQLIARLLTGATTGLAHADDLIDRLKAQQA